MNARLGTTHGKPGLICQYQHFPMVSLSLVPIRVVVIPLAVLHHLHLLGLLGWPIISLYDLWRIFPLIRLSRENFEFAVSDRMMKLVAERLQR